MARCDPIAESQGDIVGQVRAILSGPEAELDYAETKIALDRIVDPAADGKATAIELDRLTESAWRLAGPEASARARLTAIRTVLYEKGPWNGYRPFDYDHANVRGADTRVNLLSHYLETRLGDCVSMPVLLLILADRLGLQVGLASAPCHLFVRYADPSGKTLSLEATSGGNPARPEWQRQSFRMSERAIASGLYMRTLSRRENVATMAGPVLQQLRDAQRYEESIEIADAILAHDGRNAHALVNRGYALERILRRDFDCSAPFLIPIALQPRYRWLQKCNHVAFATATELGWRPDDGPIPQEQRADVADATIAA